MPKKKPTTAADITDTTTIAGVIVMSICMMLMMPPGEDDARAEPAAPAAHRDHDGLDQELGEDLPPGGAEGLADADLAHPFGERGEHDVGDDDAADQQRDDAAGEEGDVVDHVFLGALFHPLDAVPDPEVLDAVARAQQQLEGVTGFLVDLRRAQSEVELVDALGARRLVAFHVRGDRHHDQTVEPLVGVVGVGTLPEEDLLRRHADHGVGFAVDIERLADRVGGAEELAGAGGAKHHHRRCGLHVVIGDIATAAHRQLAHLHELGLDGRDPEPLLGGARAHLVGAADLRHHQVETVDGVADRRGVGQFEPVLARWRAVISSSAGGWL